MFIQSADAFKSRIRFQSANQQLFVRQIHASLKPDKLEISGNAAIHWQTRRKNYVPQKINVRAMENIARLGGGQSPFIGLAGTVVSFFKEFSYKKIGVAVSLENDMFKVNGTIKKNGLEYIVKKGGLTGVDVINLNPDNRISFKDMVKRIKRIKSTGEDPVIR